MGESTLSSNQNGHLILSGLKDSTYEIVVGFPRHQIPEQRFSFRINKKDRGFELKNHQSQGWVLYDWQALEFIRAPKTNVAEENTGVRKVDSYSFLMASVVNDSAVLYRNTQPQLVAAIQSADSIHNNAVATVDSLITRSEILEAVNENRSTDTLKQKDVSLTQVNTPPSKIADSLELKIVEDAFSSNQAAPPSDSKSTSEVKSTGAKPAPTDWLINRKVRDDGVSYSFIDFSSPNRDTIEILIPDSNEQLQSSIKTDDAPLYRDSNHASPQLVVINSDCSRFAGENDVDKLRVSMLKENEENKRADVAQKTFRNMCFTTKQIRALSELFTRDETRHKFFTIAYPFVSDSGNFKTLINLLNEPAYISQFKTLVRI